MSKILKATSITGKTLILRDVVDDYAEFIFNLRTDISNSKHINSTTGGLNNQINWIKDYQSKKNQAYFVIFFNESLIGTVRIYDAVGDSFCWGSWILNDNAPYHAAVESALIVYSYALNHLHFNQSHFDVRKTNIKVRQFHERFGAKIVDEDEVNYYYSIDNENIRLSLRKYKKFLNTELKIEFSCK